jgi:hypothetical protein
MKKFYLTYIKPFLSFLRLIDENGELSITNILVIIFAFKLAFAPMEETNIQQMALALAAIGVYASKRIVSKVASAKKDSGVAKDIVDKLKHFVDKG